MTARQRVLALKYLEKQKRNYAFAKELGAEVVIAEARDEDELHTSQNMIGGAKYVSDKFSSS